MGSQESAAANNGQSERSLLPFAKCILLRHRASAIGSSTPIPVRPQTTLKGGSIVYAVRHVVITSLVANYNSTPQYAAFRLLVLTRVKRINCDVKFSIIKNASILTFAGTFYHAVKCSLEGKADREANDRFKRLPI